MQADSHICLLNFLRAGRDDVGIVLSIHKFQFALVGAATSRLRELLELEAVRCVVESENIPIELVQLVDVIDSNSIEENWEGSLEADIQFHSALVKSANSPALSGFTTRSSRRSSSAFSRRALYPPSITSMPHSIASFWPPWTSTKSWQKIAAPNTAASALTIGKTTFRAVSTPGTISFIFNVDDGERTIQPA